MKTEPWYGAKCIFLHKDLGQGRSRVYEERVVLIKAKNIDRAIERAEKEARKYANDMDGCSYVGFVDVFHLFDSKLKSGTEVYSLMRDSKLGKNKYLDRFYDTGKERSKKE